MHKIKQTFNLIYECIAMSFRNIKGNKARSFLTMLGIMIGVMAVIALITTVSGFSGTLSDSFTGLGAGTLMVTVTGDDLKKGMTSDDMNEIASLEEIQGVTPTVSIRGRVSRGNERETNISVSGKNNYYFARDTSLISRGRGITPVDEDNRTQVCLVDNDIVEEFFFATDPIGEEIYIGGLPFTVVGILSDADSTSLASVLSGSSDIVIPYTTALRMNSTDVVSSFNVYYNADNVSADSATSALENALDPMFNFEDDCYTITSMSGIEDTMNSMMNMLSLLLGGIASIALLVGGIGIMNMMLTTVTERTMEIGLKKALGAMPWHIQLQFLIESFILSMIGGIIGIILGVAISMILCSLVGMSFVLSTSAIALGFGFSAAVGIIFGWAPARKASRLNPIDALRSM